MMEENKMSDPVIELVKLDNGDIALRQSDEPDEHMVVITFSDAVKNMLQIDQMDVARVMVEAGMDRVREIQVQRIQEVESVTHLH